MRRPRPSHFAGLTHAEVFDLRFDETPANSTRNETERVQLFARAHRTLRELPVRWFRNEGALLPDDLERLRATIDHFGLVMVALDSVYNFTPGLDLKGTAL